MQEMTEFLAQYRKPMPEWLRKFDPDANEKPNLNEVLNSRVVFYPACYDDGFMVEVFNPSHSAYVYLYADYAMTKENWIEMLHTKKLNKKKSDGHIICQTSDGNFRGYYELDHYDYSFDEIVSPEEWTPHFEYTHGPWNGKRFCRLSIFERQENYDESYGAERFALLYINDDGIMLYDALWGSKKYKAPFACLMEDYGTGGTYNTLGKGGHMEAIAKETGIYPKFMIFGHAAKPWYNTIKVPDVSGKSGGGWGYPRTLYTKEGKIKHD